MKPRLTLLTFLVALVGVFALTPMGVADNDGEKKFNPFNAIPVTGRLADGGTFKGKLDIRRLAVLDLQNGQGDQLVGTGILNGTLTKKDGRVQRVNNALVALPVSAGSASSGEGVAAAAVVCDILHLELGPLDLDLLGLVVHLDKVVLDVDAVPGPGNLLGNLLCAIAGLLDGPLPLPLADLLRVAELLNLLIDLFG